MEAPLLRKIPKMDVILSSPSLSEVRERFSYAAVKAATRELLEEIRKDMLAEKIKEAPSSEDIAGAVLKKLGHEGSGIRRVINATGVILHTNLGRAPLGEEACRRIAKACRGYCNLEMDMEGGDRSRRSKHIEAMLRELTGAEDALVVNNNAAAVFLITNTLSKGGKMAISRGELVEIGDSFRISEIIEQSGAELIEVGSTNRTRLSDYERAVTQMGVCAFLKVHTSNYSIKGFTEETTLEELSQLGRELGCPVIYDAGAALLLPPDSLGLSAGREAGKTIKSGADVMCFSADKLMGSAQAGIILGKREYMKRIRANRLARMLRIDKLSILALETALESYRDRDMAKESIPVLAMICKSRDELLLCAKELAQKIKLTSPGIRAEVVETTDEVGGGALPGASLAGYAVRIEYPGLSPERLEAELRRGILPVIARIYRGGVLLSVRTLLPEDLEEIAIELSRISVGAE